jgi:Flp pilus assembly pilin Flp
MNRFYESIAVKAALALVGASVESLKRDEGQTLAEYAMILAFVAIVVAGAVMLFGGQLSNEFSYINTHL